MQLALAPPLMVTKGFAAPEVGAVHTRALALCQQLGETPSSSRHSGVRPFYFHARRVADCTGSSAATHGLAEHVQGALLLLEAHYGLGTLHSIWERGLQHSPTSSKSLTCTTPGSKVLPLHGGADLDVSLFPIWRTSCGGSDIQTRRGCRVVPRSPWRKRWLTHRPGWCPDLQPGFSSSCATHGLRNGKPSSDHTLQRARVCGACYLGHRAAGLGLGHARAGRRGH